MERIWIIGASGSGKTTLGENIAQKLNTDAVDLDDLHWRPNWQTTPFEELIEAVDGVTSKENWVLSGNYSKLQGFLARADTLIWLDYSFSCVMSQLFRRTARRVFKREVWCNGNYETLKLVFSRDSVILWLFRTYKKRRKTALEIISEPRHSHFQILHFKTPRLTTDWFKTLETE